MGYYSNAFMQTEKNNAATEIECLAIIKVVNHIAIHLFE